MNFIHEILNPFAIISAVGLVGIWLIIFAQSGFFFCFFLPGDSLLFTAGFLASQNFFPAYFVPTVLLLFVGALVAAILGDNVGFLFGRKIGPAIFKKEDSLLFDKKYPVEAQKFYDRYGKKTIVFARFIPIVRTFAPIIAGVGAMNYRTFFSYNVFGALIWTAVTVFPGFFLGESIPNAEHYITPLILLIIVISFVPAVIHFIRERRSRKTIV